MLILTRRVGETVVIGNDVDVTVLGVKGNQVRLGVKAPREVTVHREEIYKRIKDEAGNTAQQATSQSASQPTSQPNGNTNGNAKRNGRRHTGPNHNGHNDHHPAVND